MSKFDVSVDGADFKVSIGPEGIPISDGARRDVQIRRISQDTFSVLLDDKSVKVVAIKSLDHYQVLVDGVQHEVKVTSERDRLLKRYSRSGESAGNRFEIHAPMPALVVRVEVQPGEEVKQGQGLVILEAMKMENEIKSHQAGRVKEVYVTNGKAVEKGELLLLLERSQ